jgi:hypothetical protein
MGGDIGHFADDVIDLLDGLRRVGAADCIAPIWPAISSVARAVCPASDFTSEATTEKPRPASPSRAASMVALSWTLASPLVKAMPSARKPKTGIARATTRARTEKADKKTVPLQAFRCTQSSGALDPVGNPTCLRKPKMVKMEENPTSDCFDVWSNRTACFHGFPA